MIVRIIDNGVVLDDKKVLDNLKMNLAGGGKMRIMADVCDDDKSFPVDILVYRIDSGLHKFTKYVIKLNGIERHSNKTFSLYLTYEMTKGQLTVSVKTVENEISVVVNSADDVIKILKAL